MKKIKKTTVTKEVKPDYGDASFGICSVCAGKIIDTHDGNIYSISDCTHYPQYK